LSISPESKKAIPISFLRRKWSETMLMMSEKTIP
jgi:hypothetical protein